MYYNIYRIGEDIMNSQEPKVDLSKIEEVKLDNGKTYIKYIRWFNQN